VLGLELGLGGVDGTTTGAQDIVLLFVVVGFTPELVLLVPSLPELLLESGNQAPAHATLCY